MKKILLSSKNIHFSITTVPTIDNNKIKKILEFELDEIYHIKENKHYFSYDIIEQYEDISKILVYIVPSEVINEIIDNCITKKEYDINIIIPQIAFLNGFLSHFYKDDNVMLLSKFSDYILITVISDSMPLILREVSLDNTLTSEIEKTVTYFNKNYQDKKINTLCYTSELKEYIQQPSITAISLERSTEQLISMGLELDIVSQKLSTDIIPEHLKKKLKIHKEKNINYLIKTAACLCLLLLCLNIYLFFNYMINQKNVSLYNLNKEINKLKPQAENIIKLHNINKENYQKILLIRNTINSNNIKYYALLEELFSLTPTALCFNEISIEHSALDNYSEMQYKGLPSPKTENVSLSENVVLIKGYTYNSKKLLLFVYNLENTKKYKKVNLNYLTNRTDSKINFNIKIII